MTTSSNFVFGKFRVMREIGRGASGAVYEAWQEDLQRSIALKLIRHALLRGSESERFLHEARMAASVQHPGVVAIYEVGVEAGQHFLAMELVEGRNLGQVATASMPPSEAARITVEVARAVAALHSHGIVHRDLKPENILLESDGRPRVTDFGLALVQAVRTDREAMEQGLPSGDGGPVAGTPGYMAPEQLSTRLGPVGPQADVYALGAVLHTLLVGKGPHAGKTVLELVMATLEGKPLQAPDDGDIPAELLAICRRCLEHAPQSRYPGADAVADDLERWRRGDATVARPPGAIRRVQLFFRSRRALSARLFALLAFESLAVFDHWALEVTTTAYFGEISLILALMMAASIVLDRLNETGRLGRLTHYAWTSLDCGGLTWILYRSDGLDSPLLILLPLLVIASGFWLEVKSVIFATILTMAGYGFLITMPKPGQQAGIDQHMAVLTTLIVAGVLVGLQVARTRALRDYTARQR